MYLRWFWQHLQHFSKLTTHFKHFVNKNQKNKIFWQILFTITLNFNKTNIWIKSQFWQRPHHCSKWTPRVQLDFKWLVVKRNKKYWKGKIRKQKAEIRKIYTKANTSQKWYTFWNDLLNSRQYLLDSHNIGTYF